MHIHIAFSVIQFYVSGVKKTGVCSGWLQDVTSSLRNTGDSATALCNQVAALSLSADKRLGIKVSAYSRICIRKQMWDVNLMQLLMYFRFLYFYGLVVTFTLQLTLVVPSL